jgi:hypothetical protein
MLFPNIPGCPNSSHTINLPATSTVVTVRLRTRIANSCLSGSVGDPDAIQAVIEFHGQANALSDSFNLKGKLHNLTITWSHV